ncbi:MAG: aminodeoxychorismate lyase [Proteobacteria bacterium]|nr:MAG: aminodeoxychorismate lyase [Pseudomonadota bacterium]
MKAVFKTFFFLILLSALAVGGYAYLQYEQFMAQRVSDTAPKIFEIKKGSSIKRVAAELEKQDIIKPAWQFQLLAKITKQDTKIKAGEFAIEAGMTPQDLLDRFTSGKTISYSTTIVEGFTFRELAKKIQADPNLVKTLSDEDYRYENIMAKIGSDEKNPEGWFFPDTYHYPRGTTDVDFLRRSHKAMKQFLNEQWENRSTEIPLKKPYDALILASIVEKETGVAEERPLIAQVFHNRLRKGMMLQTDPTVIYGMGERFEGNIRKSDLRRDTPYNTYTRTGLTPTPIATPSADAIKSVMHPGKTDALYFVARGNGTSHFSNSYREHRKAVIKYQLRGNAKAYQGDQ